MCLISEVTERARKLRIQYKLQAQSLRARIEMRINRVPSSLRRTKIGDLDGAHTGQTKLVEQSDQMKIIESQNNDNSKLPPHNQPLEVSTLAKKPSADLRSKEAMDKMDITGSPEISTKLVKSTPVERLVAISINTKSAERIKPMDNVDQSNIYAWGEKSANPVAKPAPAERSMTVSKGQKAPEKAKPMVKVDKSDICGATEIISGIGPAKSKSAERVTAISNNAKLAGKAKPMSNVNMMDISEPHKRNSVQLSARPAPAERLMAVSNIGTTTSARVRGIKRKR